MADDEQAATSADDPTKPRLITRRRLIAGGAATGASLVAGRAFGASLLGPILDPILGPFLDPIQQIIFGLFGPTFTTNVRRRADFLQLDYDFYGIDLDTSGSSGPMLRSVLPGRSGVVVVTFPPQHLLEAGFVESAQPGEAGGDAPNPPPLDLPPNTANNSQTKYWNQHYTNPTSNPALPNGPVPSRLAGRSRLSFTIPASLLPMPYDLAHLLDWHAWGPNVVPSTQVGVALNPYPALVAPTDTQTAIELPWHLVLSPFSNEHWQHPTAPKTLAGRTDLWLTNLQPHVGLISIGSPPPPPEPRTVRAVWTYDTVKPTGARPTDTSNDPFPAPFVPSLSAQDRYDIVQNTARSRRFGGGDPGYAAVPATVNRLSLSALGGFLDARGTWDNAFEDSLIDWRHEATMGRDQYVRIIRRGYLLPFGHPCTLVKITERKFDEHKGGNKVAYLRQRIFLVVSSGDKAYATSAFEMQHDGRQFPFVKMRCTTHTTPILDARTAVGPLFATLSTGDEIFVPQVGGQNFRFHFIGTDWRGDETELTSACVYVDEEQAWDAGHMNTLRSNYNGLTDGQHQALRVGNLFGSRVTVAPSNADGDTAHVVNNVHWLAQELDQDHAPYTKLQLINADQPRFHPGLDVANVHLTAVDQIRGKALGGIDLHYNQSYLADDFPDRNPASSAKAEVYFEPVSPQSLSYPGRDKCGGVLVPQMVISGLSRRIGPVGGSAQTINDGTFNPQDFFTGADATLLGSIDLADIVSPTASIDDAPQITTRRNGNVITTRLHFAPTPQQDATSFAGGTVTFFVPEDDATMSVDAVVVSHADDPSSTTTTVDGVITDFWMCMLGTDFVIDDMPDVVSTRGVSDSKYDFIDLHFSQMSFHYTTGQKAISKPVIDQVVFKGILSFVNDLQQYLGIGDSGPAIDVTSAGVTASVSVALPSISIGVFTLENLAFSGGVVIPFDDRSVALTFGFCSRENPFHLTIALFGGGGWFGLTLDLGGIQSFEIGLEFGAQIGIDLGVASGEVHVWAGIYFQMSQIEGSQDTEAIIQGYIRAGGSVEVLCIASVSLEAYLGFTYNTGTDKVGGVAELTLTISILCFSASVSASFQQYFGGEGDPVMGHLVPPTDANGHVLTDAQGNFLTDGDESIYWQQYCEAFGTSARDTVDTHG